MTRVRMQSSRVITAFCLLLIPMRAAAQTGSSGIAGVVRDSSGAVLPGVTVEASSPALIEKVRTAVTDEQGRYVIGDLVPGMYSVTFRLEGFSAVRRDAFALTSGFTAQVNADMKVGALEETITVSAAVPLVDVSSGKRQTIVTSDLLSTLPVSTKNLQALIEVTPGWTGLSDVGGQYLQEPGAFHGKRGTKVSFDGMVVENSDGNSSYQINAASVAEMAAQTSGLSAEVNADGPVMNMIPKEGGNSFSTIVTAMFTNYHLESGNLSDELKTRGFSKVNRTYRLYDEAVSVGGPIMKNRLWFFAAPRTWGVSKQLAGLYWNKTQDVFLTPPGATRKVVLWTPWVDRPLDARSGREEWYNSLFGRSTWQASQRNKFSFLLDYQRACNCFGRAGGTVSQEAAGASYKFQPTRLIQARWTSPRTSKLLLQAGTAFNVSQWNAFWEPAVAGDIISINDTTLGLRYGAQSTYRGNPNYTNRYSQDFAATYANGAHSYKFGIQNDVLVTNAQYIVNGNVNYTFINGSPSSITQFSTPYLRHDRGNDFGLYFQDKWRMGRLTLGYGARLDWYYGWVPKQQTPGDPSPWPTAPQKNEWLGERSYDAVKSIPSWKDLNPRVDAAYDLFGNGRTAVKFAIGRYVAKTNVDVPTANNPITTSVISAARSWSDTNRNYVPDCNLGNFDAQDLSASGGDVCGAINNRFFGQNNPNAAKWSDQVLNGWGVRDSNVDISTEVQHQLTQGLSVSAGYFFNTGGYFRNSTTTTKNRVTDNILVDRSNYDPYCITAPKDPALPNGGGYQVCGLYDINPSKFGQNQSVVTLTKNFGTPKYRNHFVDVSFDARLPGGAKLGGGLDTGYSLVDTCFVVDSPQALVNCHVVNPFKGQTQVKLNGSYPLPWDLVLAGALQSLPGVPYQADYNASTAEIALSLGRPLAGGTRTALVPLVAPNTFFEARINRLDLRISKKLKLGSRRLQLNLDAYNALNSSAITAINSTFDSRWRQPNTVIDPRLFQFSGELSF
ncbi:MAG TPA: TonB-dependent receptor [Vicinamibacterales bacterium]|nr:TonB-dependent receptor [Vicinamibacterales bacterium]